MSSSAWFKAVAAGAPQNWHGTNVAVGSRTRWRERVKFGDALVDA
jgi:hypothetical protein